MENTDVKAIWKDYEVWVDVPARLHVHVKSVNVEEALMLGYAKLLDIFGREVIGRGITGPSDLHVEEWPEGTMLTFSMGEHLDNTKAREKPKNAEIGSGEGCF